jgi:hypothetical protein
LEIAVGQREAVADLIQGVVKQDELRTVQADIDVVVITAE